MYLFISFGLLALVSAITGVSLLFLIYQIKYSEKADRIEKNRHHIVSLSMMLFSIIIGIVAYFYSGENSILITSSIAMFIVVLMIRIIFTELGIRKRYRHS